VSWQLTRTAGIGREAMHRLVGPWLGVLVGGPRVSGREWLVDLPSPLIICPNHQRRSPSVGHRGRGGLLVPTSWGEDPRQLVRRDPVPADGRRTRIRQGGRGAVARRLARGDLPRGHAQQERGDGGVQAGRRADRRGARPFGPARSDRGSGPGPAAWGTTTASRASLRDVRPAPGPAQRGDATSLQPATGGGRPRTRAGNAGPDRGLVGRTAGRLARGAGHAGATLWTFVHAGRPNRGAVGCIRSW
jgi:hypothetical protein